MSKKEIELVDVSSDHATFNTEGLYRVVFHGDVNREIYHPNELLTAKQAIRYAEIYNSPIHTDYPFTQKPKMWAEVVSYKEWEEREERCQREEHVQEMMKIERTNQREKFAAKISRLKKKLKRATTTKAKRKAKPRSTPKRAK